MRTPTDKHPGCSLEQAVFDRRMRKLEDAEMQQRMAVVREQAGSEEPSPQSDS